MVILEAVVCSNVLCISFMSMRVDRNMPKTSKCLGCCEMTKKKGNVLGQCWIIFRYLVI